MPKAVFVSYSHHQGDWVRDRLVPVLEAGGADVRIDRQRFTAGKAVRGQMDAEQDAADVHLLVLSPDYLASEYCGHEMERAVARDPRFERGVVVPLMRVAVELPEAIRQAEPLYADLTDDGAVEPWDLVLEACGADLGTGGPEWLAARDETRKLLERGRSVNLVIDGKVAWRPLVDGLDDFAVVNLEKPAAASRRGLVEEILRALGMAAQVPPEPEDLVELDRYVSARRLSCLALIHFDLAAHRQTYGVDLFASLRYLVMESRKLVLLVQSRRPFATLLPAGHPLSEIDLQTVELRSRR